jgi:amidohydrolase
MSDSNAMGDPIRKRIRELTDELVGLRRDFHRHPELGFQEHRTAEKVEGYLRGIGLTTHRLAGTGVAAVLEGVKPGPVLMLRADMDALPIQEETEVDYRSVNAGVMHACGHDAHMAMLLVAAKILVEHRARIRGTIKFVFQPNEEIAGALKMIEEGVLDDPRVDAVVGVHVWTPVESGNVAITHGTVMGGLDVFKIRIQGKGGHTGFPEDAVDPVIAAANVIQTTQIIQTREITDLESTIIMFGKIQGGTKGNIIPDTVDLEGTIRFLYKGGPESEERPTERFLRVVEGVCATHRCTCKIDVEHENIPLINDPEMVRIARAAAGEIFTDRKRIVDNRTIASEDFSEFSARVPGVFIFLGTGNPKKGADIPHHNPKFNVDEDVLPDGVELYVRLAFQYFRNAGK